MQEQKPRLEERVIVQHPLQKPKPEIENSPAPKTKIVKAGTKVTTGSGKTHVFQEDTPVSEKALRHIHKSANARAELVKKNAKSKVRRAMRKASKRKTK